MPHQSPALLSLNQFYITGVYLRSLLFWSVWLPLGRVWSVDALDDATHKRTDRRPDPTKRYCLGLATVGCAWRLGRFPDQLLTPTHTVITQVINLYVYAYYLKADPTWTRDYTAVELALRVECVCSHYALSRLISP